MAVFLLLLPIAAVKVEAALRNRDGVAAASALERQKLSADLRKGCAQAHRRKAGSSRRQEDRFYTMKRKAFWLLATAKKAAKKWTRSNEGLQSFILDLDGLA